jgi:hypothetical protein
MKARGISSVEVNAKAQTEYNDQLAEKLAGTVWNAGNCKSWYLDAGGRNPSIWPTYTWRFARQTRRFDLSAYQIASSVVAGIPVEQAG